MSDDLRLEPRDHLLRLDLAVRHDEQLAAIHAVLALHKQESKAIDDERTSIEMAMKRLQGEAHYHAQDDWGVNFYRSVYAEAAYSAGALVMLAPFIEAIFYQVYQAIALHPAPLKLARKHERWRNGDKREWDCHYVYSAGRFRKDLVRGILQISDAIDLAKNLPADLEPRLTALFFYRNKMFHHGIEWPTKERAAFERQIKAWPTTWFSRAESGHKPWIFYLERDFIDELVAMIGAILDGMGAFINDHSIGVSSLPWPDDK